MANYTSVTTSCTSSQTQRKHLIKPSTSASHMATYIQFRGYLMRARTKVTLECVVKMKESSSSDLNQVYSSTEMP